MVEVDLGGGQLTVQQGEERLCLHYIFNIRFKNLNHKKILAFTITPVRKEAGICMHKNGPSAGTRKGNADRSRQNKAGNGIKAVQKMVKDFSGLNPGRKTNGMVVRGMCYTTP
jgi:hypothetical protein